jgi:ribosomal protein L27
MGRPLRKDENGVDAIGTPVSNTGITVKFYDGSALRSDGIILKQRGAKTFVVARRGTPTVKFTCVLKNGTPSAAGEMQITGSTTGQLDAALVNCAKITKRVYTSFSGVRYTWYLESDSSADYIVLRAT